MLRSRFSEVRGRSGRHRRLAAGLGTLALAAAGLAGAPPASAAPGTVSHATGTFLSASLLGIDLATLAAVNGADAGNSGGATVVSTPGLDVTALSTVNLNLGTLSLPMGELIRLGVLNQYAQAAPDGSSYGASGAVTDQGVINTNRTTGPQGDATLDLSALLPSSVTSTIGNLTVGLGAVAATATETPSGQQSGTYLLADLDVTLTSPLVAGVATTLESTLSGVLDPALATLQTVSGGTLQNLPDVGDLVSSLTTVASADGCLTVSLDGGTVAVDVDCLLTANGLDISTLPANTDLATMLATEITQQLPTALSATVQQVISGLTSQINQIQVCLPFVGCYAAPTALLNPVIAAVTTPVASLLSGLGTTAVIPLASAVSDILGLTVNAQTTSGGVFSQTALQVQVLGDIASISLANATVGPNVTPLPAPVITAPTNGTTTGPTPTITGTGTAGATVTVMDGSTTVCTATVAAGDAWTCSPAAPLAPGSRTLTATQADGTTTSPASAPVTITVALPAPVITSPTNGATVLDTTPPTVSGNGAVSGASVTAQVADSGGTVGTCTATAVADGTWSCTMPGALSDGSYTIAATQTVGTATSAASAPVSITVGPAAGATPDAPVITSPTNGSTVASTTPPVSGTGADGSTVTVTEGGAPLCTATVSGGTWTCTSSTLASGSHTISATQNDGTTDSPASAPVTFTVGGSPSTGPTAPVITSPTNGSTTTSTTPTVAGSADAGDSVSVTLTPTGGGAPAACTATAGSGGTWSCVPTTPLSPGGYTVTATASDGTTSPASAPVTFTVIPEPPVITGPTNGSVTTSSTPAITGTGTSGASVVVSDGTSTLCSATVTGGSWSCAPTTPLDPGTYTLIATQTANGADSLPSAPVTFTVEPPAPVITSPTNGSATTSTPEITGTGTSGASVVVADDGTQVCTATVAGDGTWSCTPAAPWADGTHTLTATQTVGGVDSPPSAPVTVTVSTGIAALLPAPTITSPTDGSTSASATPPVSGTGQAGATITVTVGTTTMCTAVVGAQGTWSCSPGAPLSDGVYTVVATQADSSGTSLPSAPVTFAVDTTAVSPTVPPAPTITSPADGSTTASATPPVSGTGQAGATVTVTDGTTTLCTAVVDAQGTWSCTPGAALSDGTHTLTATQADSDGISLPSAPVRVTVDTAAAPPTVPLAPTITSPADGSTTGTTPTIAGTGQPGATVTVVDSSGTVVGTTVVDPDGSWSLVLPQPLSPGSHTFTATQTDGNTSASSAAVTFTVVADAADTSRSWLPTTGASVVTRLVGALALLVVGADLVLVAATRRYGRVG